MSLVGILFVSMVSSQSACSCCTFTQGGYGSTCTAKNQKNATCASLVGDWTNSQPACLLNACFDTTIVLGLGGPFSVTFTSASAIENFLPATGVPGQFNAILTNPTTTSAGVLAGQLLTAILNVQFANSSCNFSLVRFSTNCSLISSSLQGLSIIEVINLTQLFISQSSNFTLSVTANDLNQALDLFNNNFENCTNNNTDCFVCAALTSAPTTSVPTNEPTSLPTGAPTLGGVQPPTNEPTSEPCTFRTFNSTDFSQTCIEKMTTSWFGPVANVTCELLVANWCTGAPAACIRDRCFCNRTITLGNASCGIAVSFTEALAVHNFMVDNGTAGVFTEIDITLNPVTTSAGDFAVQLATALLNIELQVNVSNITTLRFTDDCMNVSECIRGLTILELIDIANQVIAGGSCFNLSVCFTPANLTQALNFFNNNFRNCTNLHPECFTCLPPTLAPTPAPTQAPTVAPTIAPTNEPTQEPTNSPTIAPTQQPTGGPTSAPTNVPTSAPTSAPTNVPTGGPTNAPTNVPTNVPTLSPTSVPTNAPTNVPTNVPTLSPTSVPTNAPTSQPTNVPTNAPTNQPTVEPTQAPTLEPTAAPTAIPCIFQTFNRTDFSQTCIEKMSAAWFGPIANVTCELLVSNWCNGAPAACIRDRCFCNRTIVLGNPLCGFSVSFSSEIAIHEFLAGSDEPDIFNISANNPLNTSAGIFAEELLTALMNIELQNLSNITFLRFSENCTNVSECIRGLSILEVIDIANQVIAGGACFNISDCFTPANLTQALNFFNNNFRNCTNAHPECFTCVPIIQATPPPTAEPTNSPTAQPTGQPTNAPTQQPTVEPTSGPTSSPTVAPTNVPTQQPTAGPTSSPTVAPTQEPTNQPTALPTPQPTAGPTSSPTVAPTAQPTVEPTPAPTLEPTAAPTAVPCIFRTFNASDFAQTCIEKMSAQSWFGPVANVTCELLVSNWCNGAPAACIRDRCFCNRTIVLGNASCGFQVTFDSEIAVHNFLPSSGVPSILTISATNPSSTAAGTLAGELLTALMNIQLQNLSNITFLRFSTGCQNVSDCIKGLTILEVINIANQVIAGGSCFSPSDCFTPANLAQALNFFNNNFRNCSNANPGCFTCLPLTEAPTVAPTAFPTVSPTQEPTNQPTNQPTQQPTNVPTSNPTVAPTVAPTASPTNQPTNSPTVAPTNQPTVTPTVAPTLEPTQAPTSQPTVAPTVAPTFAPTAAPTNAICTVGTFNRGDFSQTCVETFSAMAFGPKANVTCDSLVADWCNGAPAACIRDRCFCNRTIVLGNASCGLTITFTSEVPVHNFLPGSGTPGVIATTDIMLNPLTSSAGLLAAELLVATMNVQLQTNVDFSLLTFTNECTEVAPAIRGLTVLEVIFDANQVIAGCQSPPGLTPLALAQALSLFNNNFRGCSNANPRCFTCNPRQPCTAPPLSLMPTMSPPPAFPSCQPTSTPTIAPTPLIFVPTLQPSASPTLSNALPTFAPTISTVPPTVAPTTLTPQPTPCNCPQTSSPTPTNVASMATNGSCCGNGIVEAGEECDEGANNDNIFGNCTNACKRPFCGDGLIHKCNDTCTTCGVCEGEEDCDDGDLVIFGRFINGNGCNNLCQFETLIQSDISPDILIVARRDKSQHF